MTPDTVAVSAPVRDHTGAVVAALTISAPSDRVTPGLQEACTRAVVDGAHQLSELLGFGATHLPQDQE
jgi:DNA-binding IclR family transcriptional regulator